MPVHQQLKILMDSMRLRKSEFARELGTTPTTISKIYEEGRSPRSDLLEKLMEAYPNLNANWLLTGEGNMWKEGNGDQITQTNTGHDNKNIVSKGQALDLQKEGAALGLAVGNALKVCEEKLELMKDLLEEKERVIQMYQRQEKGKE